MKKYSIIKYILLLSVLFSAGSCQDIDDSEFPNTIDPGNLEWQATTHMKIKPVEGKETFVWLTNIITLEQYWGNDTVELNFKLLSAIPTDNFSKIDFYITAQEKDGYNTAPPYITEGKLLRTITDLPESGEFNIMIQGDELYEMFKSDFINPRSQAPLLEGDIFEIHWIITNKDGTIFNSQNHVEGEYRFGFTTLHKDKKPPSWEGVFNYEWIIVSGEAEKWGGVKVGDKGQIEIVETTEALEISKEFDVSHLLFNYKYGGAGKLFLNYNTGETYVEGNSEEKWVISNIDGATLEISWTYKYTADYDEYGTVRLTRTDGENWPVNFHTK
jgi:hypothetical protein